MKLILNRTERKELDSLGSLGSLGSWETQVAAAMKTVKNVRLLESKSFYKVNGYELIKTDFLRNFIDL